jgi:hypothetical protein
MEIEDPETIPAQLRNDPFLAETERVLEEVKRNLKSYWKCFQ